MSENLLRRPLLWILFDVLKVDPWKYAEWTNFDINAVRAVLSRDPNAHKTKHFFGPRLDQRKIYPLAEAIINEASVDAIELLSSSCLEAFEEEYPGGGTLVHFACLCKTSPKIMKVLIESYPQGLRERDTNGRTPLHIACLSDAQPEVVRLLIEKEPHALAEQDNRGMSPLHCACECNAKPDVIRLLTDTNYSDGCGIDIFQMKDFDGRTPLHFACENSAPLEVVQLLLEKCPSAARKRNEYQETPLHTACWLKRPVEIIKVLLETYPVAIIQEDIDDCTPLMIAMECRECPKELVHILKHVRLLFCTDTPDRVILDVLHAFVDMSWWGGIRIVLDAHPSIVHAMDLNDSVLPHVLCKVGKLCSLDTFCNVIMGRPSILQNVMTIR